MMIFNQQDGILLLFALNFAFLKLNIYTNEKHIYVQ